MGGAQSGFFNKGKLVILRNATTLYNQSWPLFSSAVMALYWDPVPFILIGRFIKTTQCQRTERIERNLRFSICHSTIGQYSVLSPQRAAVSQRSHSSDCALVDHSEMNASELFKLKKNHEPYIGEWFHCKVKNVFSKCCYCLFFVFKFQTIFSAEVSYPGDLRVRDGEKKSVIVRSIPSSSLS